MELLDAQLKDGLKSYDYKLSFLSKLVHGLVNTNRVNSLLISGPSGIGKTYTIDKVLTEYSEDLENPIKYSKLNGKITPLSFYNMLKENSDEECVLFFDDSDSILTNPISLNMLKAASEKTSRRTVSYVSSKFDATSFVFEGKIVIATNQRISKNEHFKAVVDRFHVYDMNISMTEKLAKIIDISKAENDFTDDINQKAIQFLMKNIDSINPDRFSLRTFIKLRELIELMPDSWEEYQKISGTYIEYKGKDKEVIS